MNINTRQNKTFTDSLLQKQIPQCYNSADIRNKVVNFNVDNISKKLNGPKEVCVYYADYLTDSREIRPALVKTDIYTLNIFYSYINADNLK